MGTGLDHKGAIRHVSDAGLAEICHAGEYNNVPSLLCIPEYERTKTQWPRPYPPSRQGPGPLHTPYPPNVIAAWLLNKGPDMESRCCTSILVDLEHAKDNEVYSEQH